MNEFMTSPGIADNSSVPAQETELLLKNLADDINRWSVAAEDKISMAVTLARLSSGPDAGTTETDILRASEQEGSDATWQYAADFLISLQYSVKGLPSRARAR